VSQALAVVKELYQGVFAASVEKFNSGDSGMRYQDTSLIEPLVFWHVDE
jgi:hypothetical protein